MTSPKTNEHPTPQSPNVNSIVCPMYFNVTPLSAQRRLPCLPNVNSLVCPMSSALSAQRASATKWNDLPNSWQISNLQEDVESVKDSTRTKTSKQRQRPGSLKNTRSHQHCTTQQTSNHPEYNVAMRTENTPQMKQRRERPEASQKGDRNVLQSN